MILFIHGSDTFRSTRYVHELENKFKASVDESGNSISRINGAKANPNELKTAINASSLLTPKNMIIVEDFFNAPDKTIESLTTFLKAKDIDNTQDNAIIFFDTIKPKARLNKIKKALYNLLTKSKYSPKPFLPLVGNEINNWINTEVARLGGSIEPGASIRLTGMIGDNLWQLHNEITKLVHYKNFQPITINDVESMVIGKINDNIFHLIDAISNNNKKLALELLTDQLDGGLNEMQLLSLIMRQFKILLQIKDMSQAGLTQSQFTANLKLHPFVIKKSIAQIRNFSLPKLKQAIHNLTALDANFKQGKINLRTGIELFVVNI